MKKSLLITLILLGSTVAGSAYAVDNNSVADVGGQKVAIMDTIIKDVVKESIHSLGTKIMDKYLNPNNNASTVYTDPIPVTTITTPTTTTTTTTNNTQPAESTVIVK